MFHLRKRLVGGTDGFVPANTSTHSVCKLGAGGVLTDPEADARRWCRGFLYEDGTLEFTSAMEPDTGRTVLEGGHVCINALYNAVDVIPGAERRDEVLRVVFKPDMAAYPDVNLNYWFYGFTAITSITGLANLSRVHRMDYAFSGCPGLATLDFSGFDPSGLTSLSYTFGGCTNLKTIYADSTWKLPTSGISGLQCFYNCTSLVGGAGTTYASNRTTYTYMRIDSATTPGYLTEKG